VATKTGKNGDSAGLTSPPPGTEASGEDLDEAEDAEGSLTIDVTLPEPVHAAPEDEQAVAISLTPSDPGVILGETASTTSVTLAQGSAVLAAAGAPAADAPDEPEYSRRDRLRGEVSLRPEPAAMLTADRLIETRGRKRPRPEGRWPSFVYAATLHLVNLGDSPRVRARKELDARIAAPLDGGARFIPVLTRKGGVGKTTVTTLLGMALADVREDRVVAIDANPDRGTLSERISKQTRATVRDVVTKASSIGSFSDFATLVSRDETRLDILASDTDPLLSEAFDENDYNVVADLAARFYSIVLTDCGTGIVHSVMRATLRRADAVVIVSGGSVDEARLASETLTWLEANGYGELVRNAVVALNTATQGTNLVKIDEIEAHFRSRVREVVRIPYDPQLAAGSAVDYSALRPLTRDSARELAALVVDALPTRRDG
jgi:MinD-like ATPase involved in chromosome partitioning or flagellar assembly